MKKHTGKIILWSMLMLLITVTLFVGYIVPKAWAVSYPARTFVFRGSFTNPYVILIDAANGNVVDYATGIASASETWEANDIAASQHGESDFWTAALPALDDTGNYLLCIGDNASPVETDTVSCYRYSPYTNQATEADLPQRNGRLVTGPF